MALPLQVDEHVLSKRCLDRIDEDIQRLDSSSDRGIIAHLIKRCGNAKALVQGRRIHSAIAGGAAEDTFLLNLLIEMYGKCSSLEEARLVFDSIAQCDDFSWSIMAAAYAQNGDFALAIALLRRMDLEGVRPGGSTLASIAASSDLALLELIHERALAMGETDLVLHTVLLNSFAAAGAVERARSIFDSLRERSNLVAWNAMIGANAQRGREDQSLLLFRTMDLEGIRQNKITFLNAIAAIQSLDRGVAIHRRAAAGGFDRDLAVRNALVSMYGRSGSSAMARHVFDGMERRTLITWTAMISAFAHNGHSDEAIALFFEAMELRSALGLDTLFFASALEACNSPRDLTRGVAIHEKLVGSKVKIDALAANALINMYAKCGNLKTAREIFQDLPNPGVVSWNSMISVYAQTGHIKAALEIFHRMELAGVKPDAITFMGILDAIGSSGSLLQDGRSIHSRVAALGLDSYTSLCNAILDMYAKCGSMGDAQALLNRMPEPDAISWSSVAAGHARLGHTSDALEIYRRMELEGAQPNHVTVLGVLTGFSHAGSIDDGISFFASMIADHAIAVSQEHYACLVEVLGRSGLLEEAEFVIESAPFDPGAVLWTSLLAAACDHKDVDRAERFAARATSKDPGDAGPYACLSNLYALLGRWDGVARVSKLIDDLRVEETSPEQRSKLVSEESLLEKSSKHCTTIAVNQK